MNRFKTLKIGRPEFDSLAWRHGVSLPGAGDLWEEKVDGRYDVRQFDSAVIVGETTPAAFWPFDCLAWAGEDLRGRPLIERRMALTEWLAVGVSRREKTGFQDVKICIPATGSGGELLEAVLAKGGEGVVVKDWTAPWGARWLKIKRSAVFYCRVSELLPWTGGAVLVDSETGEKRGKIALRSHYDSVRVGSILKVEAYGLHASGLLREARLDRDTPRGWLVEW
jgi:ATP-dependent DNA ligase